jgi:hypothetical protein
VKKNRRAFSRGLQPKPEEPRPLENACALDRFNAALPRPDDVAQSVEGVRVESPVCRAFQVRLRVREREQHPVQADEPEWRDRDGDGEATIVAVAEAEER